MITHFKGYKLSIFLLIPVVIVTAIILIISTPLVDDANEKLKSLSFKLNQKRPDGLTMVNESFWRTNDFSKGNIPENMKDLQKLVNVQSKRVDVLGADVFYRMAEPVSASDSSGQNVLLLHGKMFTSKVWMDIETIHFLAASGHKVVAVDLPGFGQSTEFTGSKREFLKPLISNLGLKEVFIVSPSFSGFYSVPYIESNWKDAAGYIPVAAIMNELFDKSGAGIKIPTLNIIGELDSMPFGLATKEHISNIPTSQSVIIPRASHPAYLDDPELFHKLLYNFIKEVKRARQ